MKTRKRADQLLVGVGLVETRTKAQALIMAGLANFRLTADAPWRPIEKAGQLLPESTEFQLPETSRDVSRGTHKLRRALDTWPFIQVPGRQFVDIGSSTGGFTQVLLERGAEKVLALDVGTHQLHERLRNDARVVSVEKQHVLRCGPETWESAGMGPPFDGAVADLSFISTTKVIATVAGWLPPGVHWVFLLKPQFELDASKLKKGIVKSDTFREEAITRLRDAVLADGSFTWKDCIESPILGGDGNKEYLVCLERR